MVSKRKDWPKYVYTENGRIVYKRWNPAARKFERPVRLGPAGMTSAQVWAAYLAINPADTPDKSLNWLAREYFKSDKFKRLAPGTQRNYRKLAAILNHPVNDGATTVGNLEPGQFTTPMIRRLRDVRAQSCSAAWANRQVAFLSAVFTWGLQYTDGVLTVNPCRGIERLEERKRQVYVTPAQYEALYRLAGEREQVIMEIAYCVACRGQEVLNLRREDLLDEGLRVARLKGSETNIVQWSQRLRAAVARALRLHKPDSINPYLIPGTAAGGRLNKSTFDTAWQRLKAKGIEAGVEVFNPHDLKKAGYTDGADENLTGHKSKGMQNLYRLKPRVVKPAG